MTKFREVSAEEFKAFLKAYPRPLCFDVAGMCEPPLATYNDFTIAPLWPDSVVASHRYNYYTDEPERFAILQLTDTTEGEVS